MPPVEQPDMDPKDRDPRETGLRRRAGSGAVNPWLLVMLIILVGVAFYVALAVL